MKTPWTKRKQRLRILRKIEERKKEARENSDAILNENMHKKRKQLSYAPIINGTFLNPQEETKMTSSADFSPQFP